MTKNEGSVYLDQLTWAWLTKFRHELGNAAQATGCKHERLFAFLWFCFGVDWITKNPAIVSTKTEGENTRVLASER